MNQRPYAKSRLANFVATRVIELRSSKSQIEIATQAGFPNPNMISMIKNGASKLALDRVPALAKALECDAAQLMRLTLEQAFGGTAAVALVEILGSPVTENERGWIAEIRNASENSDPRMTGRGRTALRSVFGK